MGYITRPKPEATKREQEKERDDENQGENEEDKEKRKQKQRLLDARPTYGDAFNTIVTTHRRSPQTSASSVIMLVAPDVDAICAARMLADLFKQDDVMHRIIPVAGTAELQDIIQHDLANYRDLHTLILLNMGSFLDLATICEGFDPRTRIHVIDSTRPINIRTLFGVDTASQRIVFWDDDHVDEQLLPTKLDEDYELYISVPPPDSEDEADSDSDEEEDDDEEGEEEGEGEGSSPPRKRRSKGGAGHQPRKKRKLSEEELEAKKEARALAREERAEFIREWNTADEHVALYNERGITYGQSAAATVYILATVLERVDNDLLWLAILGLTHQYITSRIPIKNYEWYHTLYQDEVSRLNPDPVTGLNSTQIAARSADDNSLRTTQELHFMLYRHWTLYDSMLHSPYIAGRLGIWKERGRKRLTGLLAKMGFSIPQTQQPYPHMDLKLKNNLHGMILKYAEDGKYDLPEITYPSFMRCFGYRSQPLSAADAVECLSALLDVAGGTAMQVEVEGARNGGEWFGGGRAWEHAADRDMGRRRDDERENIPPGAGAMTGNGNGKKLTDAEGGEEEEEGEEEEVQWWQKNFWSAFDALSDLEPLRAALPLSMSLHRAIIRQGTSIIDHQDIKEMRHHRIVVLNQGPDLALFSHPNVLSRLALWLVEALKNFNQENKLRDKPFVVCCLDEKSGTYICVGLNGANGGMVKQNEFGLAFLRARDSSNARSKHNSFDANVIEIARQDLKIFLERLCEGEF